MRQLQYKFLVLMNRIECNEKVCQFVCRHNAIKGVSLRIRMQSIDRSFIQIQNDQMISINKNKMKRTGFVVEWMWPLVIINATSNDLM